MQGGRLPSWNPRQFADVRRRLPPCYARSKGGSRRLPFSVGLLISVRQGGFAHPCALIPCFDAGGDAVLCAGTVTVHHVPELGPVDRAEVVVAALFIPREDWIGQRHAK